MNTLEMLERHLSGPKWSFAQHLVPPIVCMDGFRMSVQASSFHYCSPRSDIGPWSKVEIGFPNQEEPLLFYYAEDPEEYTGTVYSCVPISLVATVIDKHGGFNFGSMEK